MAKISIFTTRIGRTLIYLKEAYFPTSCINCRVETKSHRFHLCEKCFGDIELIKTDTCNLCGRISNKARYCPNCRRKSQISGLLIAAKFDGPVRELIHYYKYDRYLSIADILSKFILKKVEIFRNTKNVVLVPVPLHWLKKIERGFNQAEVLSNKVSKLSGIKTISAVKRVRYTDPQMKLNRKMRLTNLHGSFKVRYPDRVSGKVVLLLDDVTTTGTTLEECAMVLKKAGAKQVWGLVIAKG